MDRKWTFHTTEQDNWRWVIAIDHADNFKSIQLKLPPVKTKKFSKTAGIDETARAVGRAKAEQIEEIFTRKLTKN